MNDGDDDVDSMGTSKVINSGSFMLELESAAIERTSYKGTRTRFCHNPSWWKDNSGKARPIAISRVLK